jgi:hypothetical protein
MSSKENEERVGVAVIGEGETGQSEGNRQHQRMGNVLAEEDTLKPNGS